MANSALQSFEGPRRWKFIQGEIVNCDSLRVKPFAYKKFPLIICDPPYGNIVDEAWDKTHDYHSWMLHCDRHAMQNATICMWGSIGKNGERPFLEFVLSVEKDFPEWQILNWITWQKQRAYGVARNYLWCREECLILTRGCPTFNIPYLNKKRVHSKGWNPKYPPKDSRLRRSNVWTDITQLLKGLIHPTQKPELLYQVLIETHSKPLDEIYDPCAGSLTTMRACENLSRRFYLCEKERKYIFAALEKKGTENGKSSTSKL